MKYTSLAFVSAFAALTAFAAPALAQDAAAGEKVFAVCKSCHKVGEDAKNGVGPQLNGLFAGRHAGRAEGYNYSDAYKALDKVWDEDNFRIYIKDPKGTTPGTKMPFLGIKGSDADQKISDLIAYLKQFGADGKKAM